MEVLFSAGGSVTAPKGFMAGAAMAGVKKAGRYDVTVVSADGPAAIAAVFTTNKVKAAPVLVSQEHLGTMGGQGRAAVFNSGCANACTGEQGLADARQMAEACAAAIGCKPQEVLVASTGVIGAYLPMEKVLPGISESCAGLSAENGGLAAKAIMTTDTFAKEAATTVEVAGHKITLGAMAKGSGMIHPNMATLLAMVTTDCAIMPALLQKALLAAAEATFNMVTVDGDTSTNDCLFAIANGQAGNPMLCGEDAPGYAEFARALTGICRHLAQMIAKDGEGATKFLTVRVEGVKTEADARLAAKTIAGSALVKAAIYGKDANWGRILCALGYSGADFDPALVDMYLGPVQMMDKGRALLFDEAAAAAYLAKDEILAVVCLNQGEETATAWGCDLTHAYVTINADYRS